MPRATPACHPPSARLQRAPEHFGSVVDPIGDVAVGAKDARYLAATAAEEFAVALLMFPHIDEGVSLLLLHVQNVLARNVLAASDGVVYSALTGSTYASIGTIRDESRELLCWPDAGSALCGKGGHGKHHCK